MFNFEHTKLTQTQFEELAQLLTQFKKCNATTNFDVGKIKVELNLPQKAKTIFKKQRATRIPLQLQDRVQKLTRHFDRFRYHSTRESVNTDSLTTGNTFVNPVIIFKKGELLKIVSDARQLNTMIDETKGSWPIEPIHIILTRINFSPVFSIADIGSAGFSSIMSSIVRPLIRKNKIITYLDDVFIQDTTTDTILQKLDQYHNTSQLTTTKKREIENYVRFLRFISKYIYNLQVILRPFCLQLWDTKDFKWTPELQKTFDRAKRNLQTEHSASQFLIQTNHFYFSAMPLAMALELHFSKKLIWKKLS